MSGSAAPLAPHRASVRGGGPALSRPGNLGRRLVTITPLRIRPLVVQPQSGLSAQASPDSRARSGDAAAGARLPIDIRRFPWIRRLAADYVFDHSRVADFFAGNPDDPAAWRDAIARTQRHARQHAAVADLVQAQQRSRGRSGSRGGGSRTTPGPADRRHRHRSAGGALRRAALHAAESAHDDSPRGTGASRARGPDGRGVLDRRRGPRLGRGQGVRRARCRDEAARHRRRRSTAGACSDRWRAFVWTSRSTPPSARSRPRCRQPSSRPRCSMTCAGPTHRAPEWPTRSDAGWSACSAHAGWSCSMPPIRRPSRSSRHLFAREIEQAGQTARLASEAGTALESRGYHAQATPQEGSLALFHMNAGRQPIKPHAGGFLVGERSESTAALLDRVRAVAGGVQPERAAAPDRAGHAVPHGLLRRRSERARPTSVSSAASMTPSPRRCR